MFTDHKPLHFALFRVSPSWSARQQCHLSYLSKFTSDLIHLPSPQNVVADALSRPSSVLPPAASAPSSTVDMFWDPGLNPFREFLPGSAPSCVVSPSPRVPVSALQSLSSALPVDFSILFSLQLSCPGTTALLGNPSLRVVSMLYGESSVLCDLSTGSPQPLVPVSLNGAFSTFLGNLCLPGWS